MSVATFVGVRYAGFSRALSETSENRYLSFVSLISLVGMVLGVIALIVVVSVMNGFDSELKKRILGVVPHVVIEGDVDLGDDPRILARAPFLQRSGLLLNSSSSQLVSLYGIDSAIESSMSIIPDYMVVGSMQDLAEFSQGIILGHPLAYRLGVMVGDDLVMVIPEPSKDGNTVSPKISRFRLVGTFELDAEVDYRLALVNYSALQKVLGSTEIDTRLRLANVFDAPIVRAEWQALGKSTDWTEQYGDFFQTVKMEKIMMFLLLSLIVAIAAFNIVSSLSMMVKDKQKDIAVLRTFGLAPMGVMKIFVVQGAVIGIAGVTIGTVLGLLLAYNITDVVGFFESLSGSRMLAGTYFDSVPSDIRFFDIAIIVAVTLTISFLATLYPAWRAASLEPARVLRNE
jgi:lipoprotein-releasing system permease protein